MTLPIQNLKKKKKKHLTNHDRQSRLSYYIERTGRSKSLCIICGMALCSVRPLAPENTLLAPDVKKGTDMGVRGSLIITCGQFHSVVTPRKRHATTRRLGTSKVNEAMNT